MTAPMVERVARALAACWADSDNWLDYCDEACAAISAMREPTPAMHVAGGAVETVEPDGPRLSIMECVAIECWQAMLDTALEEKPPPS